MLLEAYVQKDYEYIESEFFKRAKHVKKLCQSY